MKKARKILILALALCLLCSTAAFAKTYVGNMSVRIYSSQSDVNTGHVASYLYRLYQDKITASVCVGGRDKSEVNAGSCYTKLTANKTGATLTAKCGYSGAASGTKKKSIGNKNSSCQVKCRCIYASDDRNNTLFGK